MLRCNANSKRVQIYDPTNPETVISCNTFGEDLQIQFWEKLALIKDFQVMELCERSWLLKYVDWILSIGGMIQYLEREGIQSMVFI